jgi:hypothetical protein
MACLGDGRWAYSRLSAMDSDLVIHLRCTGEPRTVLRSSVGPNSRHSTCGEWYWAAHPEARFEYVNHSELNSGEEPKVVCDCPPMFDPRSLTQRCGGQQVLLGKEGGVEA